MVIYNKGTIKLAWGLYFVWDLAIHVGSFYLIGH